MAHLVASIATDLTAFAALGGLGFSFAFRALLWRGLGREPIRTPNDGLALSFGLATFP